MAVVVQEYSCFNLYMFERNPAPSFLYLSTRHLLNLHKVLCLKFHITQATKHQLSTFLGPNNSSILINKFLNSMPFPSADKLCTDASELVRWQKYTLSKDPESTRDCKMELLYSYVCENEKDPQTNSYWYLMLNVSLKFAELGLNITREFHLQ